MKLYSITHVIVPLMWTLLGPKLSNISALFQIKRVMSLLSFPSTDLDLFHALVVMVEICFARCMGSGNCIGTCTYTPSSTELAYIVKPSGQTHICICHL